MLTAKEQEIIDKVKAEKLKYKHLEAYPPHEQDNIPNPFDILTREELQHLQENPHLLELLNDFFTKVQIKNLHKNNV